MQRKFITNLGLLLLLNFLIKPFWIFGIDRTVQNMFSTDYGVYFALFNFSLLFNMLLDLGITNFNNRNIAQNQHQLSDYFSGIVLFKFLLAIIYLIVTFTVGFTLGYDSSRFYMLLVLSINQILISFIQYLRSNVSGLLLFRINSFFSVLDKTLMIIFCAILLWGNILTRPFTLMDFIYAQSFAYIVTAFILFVFVLSKSGKFSFKIDWQFSKNIIIKSFPYALLVITMMFYYRLDAIMLDLMLNDKGREAGIYAQSYRLMDAVSQIGVLFATLLLPMFSNMIKQKQKVNDLARLSFNLIFFPAISLAIYCLFFSTQIISLLYDYNVLEASQLLIVLMFCFVAIASTYVFGTLLTANGSLKSLNILALIGLVINLGLNYILIPKYYAFGSAIASLITQVIVLIVQVIMSNKIFNIQFSLSWIIKFLFYLFLITSINYILYIIRTNLLLGILINIGLYLIIGFAIKIYSIQNIKYILKNNDA